MVYICSDGVFRSRELGVDVLPSGGRNLKIIKDSKRTGDLWVAREAAELDLVSPTGIVFFPLPNPSTKVPDLLSLHVW